MRTTFLTTVILWNILFGVSAATIAECRFSLISVLSQNTGIYLDRRILEPAIGIAIDEVRNTTLRGCEVNWIALNLTTEVNSCSEMEDSVAALIADHYYQLKKDTRLPQLTAVIGTSWTDATAQVSLLGAGQCRTIMSSFKVPDEEVTAFYA